MWAGFGWLGLDVSGVDVVSTVANLSFSIKFRQGGFFLISRKFCASENMSQHHGVRLKFVRHFVFRVTCVRIIELMHLLPFTRSSSCVYVCVSAERLPE